MTFEDFLKKPHSKKIGIVEIDAPLEAKWINYKSGLWYSKITPGDTLTEDDNGNFGFYGNKNTEYFNIRSLNVDGEFYSESLSLAAYEVTDKSWFYDVDTTNFYIHLDGFKPPELFIVISPGAVIGFTRGEDLTTDNYFDDIYYLPIIKSLPSFSKKKDLLFFGILQFKGGVISFNNTGGELDTFSQLNLFGQPVRIKLTFEGLDFSEALLVYTGRVGKLNGNFTAYQMKVLDIRQLFSRKLPIHSLNKTDYPSLDDSLEGVPIPNIWGPVIKVPAYRTSSGNWIFCDTEFNNVDSPIIVYKDDDTIFSHGGTVTDGTFTGSDTTEQLTVSCRVSVIENGLDVIADALQNYEKRDFNSTNYLLTEWNAIQPDVSTIGMWIGRGNLKTTAQIIEQVCTDNQGVFDVLSDGRFTFVRVDETKEPTTLYQQDEIINEVQVIDDPDELVSSVKIEHSKNWKTNEFEIFTNDVYEDAVFARSLRYKEHPFKTCLTRREDSDKMSELVMDLSKEIKRTIIFSTKTQYVSTRILDNAVYTYKRQNKDPITPESLYYVLGIVLNLSTFEISHTIKFIKEQIPVPDISGVTSGAVYGLDVYGLDVYGL